MTFDLTFPRANNYAISAGTIKAQSEDFYVEELMSPELKGEGEHVWLWLEKKGQNTEYVAKAIARFAGVRTMDVGFSGLKDRWAVTRQWFSVYLGNKPEPDWASFELEDVSILKHDRHIKKLRRGEHHANYFRIIVSDLSQTDELEDALAYVRTHGFPNYYGAQRFGRHGSNLERGVAYFKGEIKASRSQRSFYLSAARSYLFNLNLADVIRSGQFTDSPGEGPLYGDPQPNVAPLTEAELALYEAHPDLAKGIHQNRLKLERRPYCIQPASMSWRREDAMLTLEFDLPTGVFATTLLAEVIDCHVALGEV